MARTQVTGHRPNLMLMVDTSGSMTQPINPFSASCRRSDGTVCGVGGSSCDPATCPTRWSTLQQALGDFLSQRGTLARIGLATYPSLDHGDFCGPSVALRSALPSGEREDGATLQQKAQEAKNILLAISNDSNDPSAPRGGTPTGPSLRFLESLPELRSATREDFVLLVSDGAPNCNGAFASPAPDARCFCTLTSCATSYTAAIGCLDQDNTVAAVRSLRAQGIKTFVVGFGSDMIENTELGRQTAQVFNAMADEGGFARTCTEDLDCGGERCDLATNRCDSRFYGARTGAELQASLQALAEKLSQVPCLVRFDSAATFPPESLEVSLDGQVLAPGADTWALTAEGVRFSGAACQRIQAATSSQPVALEVRRIH